MARPPKHKPIGRETLTVLIRSGYTSDQIATSFQRSPQSVGREIAKHGLTCAGKSKAKRIKRRLKEIEKQWGDCLLLRQLAAMVDAPKSTVHRYVTEQ